jgi:hypothetical protein
MTWEERRHAVAIAGRVVDARTGPRPMPIAGVEVTIVVMPEDFKETLARRSRALAGVWEDMAERLDRTWSRADGLFYFLDLPEGQYSVRAVLPNCGERYGEARQDVKVARQPDRRFDLKFFTLPLPPTAVTGTIATAADENDIVSLAEVRVKGSGERMFSDNRGQFRLTAIEPGDRVLQVAARGYLPTESKVTVAKAGGAQTPADFRLKKN